METPAAHPSTAHVVDDGLDDGSATVTAATGETDSAAAVEDMDETAEVDFVDSLLPVVSLLPPKPNYADLSQAPAHRQTPAQLRHGYKDFVRKQVPPPPKDPRPRKRPRTHNKRQLLSLPAPRSALPASPLGHLPVELTEEVCRYLEPAALAALAVTCTYFRQLFMNANAVRLWRRARHNVVPAAVPDPPQGWSEHKFGAFLFGWAPCEICKNPTNKLPLSFSLRAKICQRPSCRKTFTASLVQYSIHQSPVDWLYRSMRHLEAQPELLVRCDVLHTRAKKVILLRKGEFSATVQSFNNSCSASDDATARAQWLIQQLPLRAAHEYWVQLVVWAAAHETHEKAVLEANDKLIKTTATAQGWARRDAFNSPTMITLARNARHNGKVATVEIARHIPTIKQEVDALGAARQRREANVARQHVLDELAQLHAFLVTSRPGPLPQLHEFRRLTSVQTIAATGTPNRTLSNGDVVAHIDADLSRWAERVRHDLAKLLPPEDADDKSKAGVHWVHPALRLDTLFMCGRCEDGAAHPLDPESKLKVRAGQRPTWRAMSCTAVCQHVCPGLEKTAGKGSITDTKYVKWDETASRAAAAALRAVRADAVTATSAELESVGAVFRCTAEGCGLTMPFARVALHILRHKTDTVDFDCVDAPGPSGVPVAFESAFVADGKGRAGKIVVCRHCKAKQGDPAAVRQHVEIRHAVPKGHVGDEDFAEAE